MHWLCIAALLFAAQLSGSDQRANKVTIFTGDSVFPQVADGNGWTTRITLVNVDPTAGTFTLWFYHSDGTPWNITLKGQGTASKWTGTLQVGASLFLETAGTAAATTSGWAYLETSDRIGGMAVFKVGWLPTHDAEAVVPIVNQFDDHYFLPFDNRAGYVTSLALVNPSTYSSETVTLAFLNPDGTRFHLDQFTLSPLHQITFATTDRYPQSIGRNGVIEIIASTWGVPGLGLLFNPRYSFTSVHALAPLY